MDLITNKNIDEILGQLNVAAACYETYVINSLGTEMKFTEFEEHVAKETMRLGPNLMNQLMRYIYSIMWCYANISADEGDFIRTEDRHAEKGAEMVANNPSLIGLYVFPLILYGAEYIAQLVYIMPEERLDFESLGIKISYDSYISATAEVALQGRYCHLKKCHNEEDLGNPDYRNQDFSGEFYPEGKVIDASEEGL